MSDTASVFGRFRHEALLYANEADFMAGTVPFIRDGVRAGEPVLVVESLQKINQLRSALGTDADHVVFADMAVVGSNPARIIPAWQDFVDQHQGAQRLRGIGEPIWSGRSSDELVECQRHEALLNTAFAKGRPWWLLCPYDIQQLPADVIEEARRAHEYVASHDAAGLSPDFASELRRPPLDAPLDDPATVVGTYSFNREGLALLRHQLMTTIVQSRLSKPDALHLLIAANEIATNSVMHGGGRGVARIWFESDKVVCEFRDAGVVDQPLADRRRPGAEPSASRGLWLANQLCELVQIRSGSTGTVIRLHKLLAPGGRLKILSDSA